MSYHDDAPLDLLHDSPSASDVTTPTPAPASPQQHLSHSIYNAFGGLIRRLSSDHAGNLRPFSSRTDYASPADSSFPSSYAPSGHDFLGHEDLPSQSSPSQRHAASHGYTSTPYARTASPLSPPPLEPLTLSGFLRNTPDSAKLLTPPIAEEIRIMVPERLRIEDEWKLVYSLDQDGASLATLYHKCARHAEYRKGFVLVVQDNEGGIFGAYLSEYPHPAPHYFGTGECFLWRASLLVPLPPPPIATSQPGPPSPSAAHAHPHGSAHASAYSSATATTASPAPTPLLVPLSAASPSRPPTVPPEEQRVPRPPSLPSIRFSAFPYSGVNEYFMYCESHSLSIGGGDGKYGLWLNDSLEKGVSSTCLTFGNQPLSDEGDKFGILGIEVWAIGSR